MKIRNIILLLFFVLVSQSAGLIGAFVTTPAISSWYVYLNKPFFTPPSWLFAPVWTLLYFLMGISAYLIYREGFKKKKVQSAIYLFIIQLVLNILWSYIFFGYRLIFVAFVEILILWVFIFLTIRSFSKINKLAGNLLIPYLAWVSFASLLNLSVALLN